MNFQLNPEYFERERQGPTVLRLPLWFEGPVVLEYPQLRPETFRGGRESVDNDEQRHFAVFQQAMQTIPYLVYEWLRDHPLESVGQAVQHVYHLHATVPETMQQDIPFWAFTLWRMLRNYQLDQMGYTFP